eukprot:GILJ01005628.1.p1 GENE.GILJ01005628.1~~GILJ01005628.1.p1  ORF type:complete len:159 (+),score=20.55 GILJ01005628.1:38-514(+)
MSLLSSITRVQNDALVDVELPEFLQSSSTNKLVALYFSAIWCPPCRNFSPTLASFLKEHEDEFAVIYVSCDNNEDEMKENVAGKGYLCIPFDDWQLRQKLSSELSVSMIPSLIIMDPRSGQVVSTWGKSAILKNRDHCLQEWSRGHSGVSWLQLMKFW